jgi:flagellar protein FlaJ
MEDILNPFQRLSYQTFYGMAKRSAQRNYKLREYLEKGHMPMLAEVYIATMWMATLLTVIVGIMAFFVLQFILVPILAGVGFPVEGLSVAGIFLPSLIALLSPVFVFLGFKMWPRARVKQRASDIDVYLPYAANFVAALAAANATPQKIFMSLAAQKHIYGEVADEAKWIYRDMTLLGTDLLTALKRAVKRAPSTQWQEFLQGVVGTLTSGGDLKLYFLNRGEYYMLANRREQKTFLDTLAFMAESYVIVAVAMPMFLMIILTITFWISGSGYSATDTIMYLFSWVAMPVVHFAYITFVRMATPKV